MKDDSRVLIGNGEIFLSKILYDFLDTFSVIAVDGGANYCDDFEIVPEKIIGDFDSITSETRKIFEEKKVFFQHIQDQNSTDLEKAIINTEAKNLFCFGFTGNYLDHEVSLLHILQKNFESSSHSNKKNIFIFSANQIIFVLPPQGKVQFSLANISFPTGNNDNSRISFYPLTPTVFKKSTGLEYPLDGLTLEQGKIIGTSNARKKESDTVSWEISTGCTLGFFPIYYAPNILEQIYDISLA